MSSTEGAARSYFLARLDYPLRFLVNSRTLFVPSNGGKGEQDLLASPSSPANYFHVFCDEWRNWRCKSNRSDSLNYSPIITLWF